MRYILAGGPTCGKTSLLKALERKGHLVVPEAAREVINEGKIPKKTPAFQLEIFRRQVERENNSALPAFFDRSALEGIAYSRKYLSEVPSEIADFNYTGRYHQIFLLERLPFQNDGSRVEKDDAEAEEVHREIVKAYVERDFSLIHVPVFEGGFQESVARRADYVIKLVERLR